MLSIKGLYISGFGHRYQGNQLTDKAEKMARMSQDKQAILFCRSLHALTMRFLGNPRKAIELTEGLIESMRETLSITTLSTLIFNRGIALAECGKIKEAMELLEYGIDTCEKFGGLLNLGRLYNCLGYCYSEIYNPEMAWELNIRGEDVARKLMDQYPMGRHLAGEVVAQANVNLMENLFDQGQIDAAWDRLKALEEESNSEDFARSRDRWVARKDILASEILLKRNEVSDAESIVQRNLEIAKREHLKKYEGRFLRLLGEIQLRRKEIENAISNFNEAILILREVGNRRQNCQAQS
jgi:tetratricopeptide (TPR) repeat protein